ncbi:MAG: OmpA family protein [Myxococcota bacterium]
MSNVRRVHNLEDKMTRRIGWTVMAIGALIGGAATAAEGEQATPTKSQEEYIQALEEKARCEHQRAEAALQQLEQAAGAKELTVHSNVFFTSDDEELNPEAKAHLEELAQLAVENPEAQVRIEAYTDAQGSEDYNLTLSDERAQSVKDFFTAAGVDASRIIAEGKGETEPIASNDTPEGRAQNRRTAITIESAVGGAGEAQGETETQTGP